MNTSTLPYSSKICDPIHGFIRFNESERELIDSPAFQRLRYIHQMGVTYLIYPGATHSRFEHSLGVMQLATLIYDALLAKSYPESIQRSLPQGEEEIAYYREIVRMAALAHDLGHLPFSHTAEEALLGEKGHEEMTYRLIEGSLALQRWQEPSSDPRHPMRDLLKVTLGKKAICYGMQTTPWEEVLNQIITDDYFGADRMDYLLRDARATGVGFGQVDYLQIIDTLSLVNQAGGFALAVSQDGLQAVESLLLARYMMFARVYHHPKSRLYTKHMERALVKIYGSTNLYDPTTFLEKTDYSALNELAHLAKQGDCDAKALLKLAPPYQEILLSTEQQEALWNHQNEVKKRFREDIFIDTIPFASLHGSDSFYIITDSKGLVLAESLSPFLQLLKEKSRAIRLFAESARVPEVRLFLDSIAYSGLSSK